MPERRLRLSRLPEMFVFVVVDKNVTFVAFHFQKAFMYYRPVYGIHNIILYHKDTKIYEWATANTFRSIKVWLSIWQ